MYDSSKGKGWSSDESVSFFVLASCDGFDALSDSSVDVYGSLFSVGCGRVISAVRRARVGEVYVSVAVEKALCG